MDLLEEKDRLVARLELPGVDPKTVQINLQGDMLTISGTREDVGAAGENGKVLKRDRQDDPADLLLGLGVSHEHLNQKYRSVKYDRPLEKMETYLTEMDRRRPFAWGPPTRPIRVIAALGPKMLQLARRLSDGAHTYLAPVEHTRRARAILGHGAILAVEQGVVLGLGSRRGLDVAREHARRYATAPNYATHLQRLGYSEADIDSLPDRLVRDLVVIGDIDDVTERVSDHLAAGASHVCPQVLTQDPHALSWSEWDSLAVLTERLG